MSPAKYKILVFYKMLRRFIKCNSIEANEHTKNNRIFLNKFLCNLIYLTVSLLNNNKVKKYIRSMQQIRKIMRKIINYVTFSKLEKAHSKLFNFIKRF